MAREDLVTRCYELGGCVQMYMQPMYMYMYKVFADQAIAVYSSRHVRSLGPRSIGSQ